MYSIELTESYFQAQDDAKIHNVTVGGLLREVAAAHTQSIALVEIGPQGENEGHWSYGELLEDAERLAYALASRFKKGEHVVIWSPNSAEWVLMEYAAALSGLVVVTANPALQEKELRYIIEQSGAVGLFLVPEFRGNPMAEIAAGAIKGNQNIREVTDMNDLPSLYRNDAGNGRLPDVDPQDAAQIQYTSGTTGFPKGAVLSHLGLVNNAQFYAARCGVTADSTWINIMPMFHTSGCGMVTLGCLSSGCRMVLVSLFDADTVVDLIQDFQADIILGVPTMVLALLEAQESRPRHCDSLKVVSCGGANVAPEMIRRVQANFDCAFSTLYGQTEYCPVITQHHLTDSVEDICNTIGQPLSQTDVSIQSVEEHKTLPVGEIGEICARGPCTMLAYHGDADATAEAIDEDSWLHTGDLGYMDSRGYVTITGRVKEMIIRGGENHFPAEIENVLREHPAISDVTVVGIPDEKWGEVIAAYIRFKDQAVTDNELKVFCRAQMSPQKTPTLWRQVKDFPLTGSGKIQKFKLRDMELAGQTTPLMKEN